jgi:hypothetical protein
MTRKPEDLPFIRFITWTMVKPANATLMGCIRGLFIFVRVSKNISSSHDNLKSLYPRNM